MPGSLASNLGATCLPCEARPDMRPRHLGHGLCFEGKRDGCCMWLESSQADALGTLTHCGGYAENSPAFAKKVAPTVLIVDDEALLRWSLAETLRDAGFQVVEAGDGASAMRAFSSGGVPTDAVLLDLHLPDSGDLRLFTAIHAHSPATPVILMTAYGTAELQEEACGRGAFMVLDKPFEMSAISPILEQALHAPPPVVLMRSPRIQMKQESGFLTITGE